MRRLRHTNSDPCPANSYTAIVSGESGGTEVGLVEGYDLDQAADSQLANISTRSAERSPIGAQRPLLHWK